MKQRIATKAVIENPEGKVLVLREAHTYKEGTHHGHYHLPGGRIEVGEPFLDGLMRELREETGLDEVHVEGPVFVGEWFPVIQGVPNQIVAIFFACTTRQTKVRLSDEHDAFAWISAQEMADYNLLPPYSEVILAWSKRRTKA